jgi:hypothetical protein
LPVGSFELDSGVSKLVSNYFELAASGSKFLLLFKKFLVVYSKLAASDSKFLLNLLAVYFELAKTLLVVCFELAVGNSKLLLRF